MVVGDAFEEVSAAEFWPERGSDVDLGVGELPEKKIAQAHFAAGADDEIGVGQVTGVEVLRDDFFGNFQVLDTTVVGCGGEHGVEGVNQFRAGAVVEGESQNHARIARGFLARPFHFLLNRRREFVEASDVLQADVVFVKGRNFLLQIAREQLHEEGDFGLGAALPVFFGECVKSQRRDADA